MSFKWDWDKRELVEGDGPEKDKTVWDLFLVGSLVYWGYWFIEHIFPVICHFFLGGFL